MKYEIKYPIERRLKAKIDLMCERCSNPRIKRDAVLIIEGAEGEGKTTCSIGLAFYCANKLDREFGAKNVFFNLPDMIEFLQNSEGQIAVWDEPALYALSGDFASSIVKDLTRLLMMVRKKRHFIFINITHFNKFNDYVICQRPLGMIHVYSRKGIEAGRFVFIRKKFLEPMYNEWRSKKIRNYMKYAKWSGRLRGTFPDVLSPYYKNNVLDFFDNNLYEENKDNAIKMIGKTKTSKKEEKMDAEVYKARERLVALRKQIAYLTFPIPTKQELAKQMGFKSIKSINDWRLAVPEDISGKKIYPKRNKVKEDIDTDECGV